MVEGVSQGSIDQNIAMYEDIGKDHLGEDLSQKTTNLGGRILNQFFSRDSNNKAVSNLIADIRKKPGFGDRYADLAQAKLTSLVGRGNPLTGRVTAQVLSEVKLARKNAKELTRAQCKDLTRLISRNQNPDMKMMHARMLATLLPRLQTLAKNSQADFDAYQSLVSTAGNNGLLNKEMTGKIMDFQQLKPSETLGLLKAVKENQSNTNGDFLSPSYWKPFGRFGEENQSNTNEDFLSQVKKMLLDKMDSLPGSNYQNTSTEEKGFTAEKRIQKFLDQTVEEMKETIEKSNPSTDSKKNLKKELLLKYQNQSPQSITERDLGKMGELTNLKRQQLNLGVLAKFLLKEGDIKTTEYTNIKDKEAVKNRIKDSLGQDKIIDHDGIKKVISDFREDSVNNPEELNYLKNKLKKKIHDYLPVAGNDPGINKMNQAIIQGLKKDLFIAPEKLKSEMMAIEKKLEKGGGNAIIYLTGTKEDMLNNIETAKAKPTKTPQEKKKYQMLSDQLEQLTKGVNKSRKFAFKCFNIKEAFFEETWNSAQKEMVISKQLNHPNIVNSYFSIEDTEGNRVGMVMDCCEKGDFSKVMTEDAKMPEKERQYDPDTSKGVKNIAKTILGAMKGLHQMHQLGFVHRDIKPENIFMTKDDTPKLGDFGLAKKLDTQVRGIGSEEIQKLKDGEKGTMNVGTAQYMAPEVANGYNASSNLDTYSMGMTALSAMFKCDEKKLTGNIAFNFQFTMKEPEKAKAKIENWLNDGVFDKTEQGKQMKNFISKSLEFSPENRIGYDDAVKILENIIGL